MARRPHRTVASLMLLVAAFAVILTVAVRMQRQRIIETLHLPVATVGWSSTGLRLSDGRAIPLPGIRTLPTASPLLAEVTKRGVEIDEHGRVHGLVRIHHWCGNDSVGEHIARVDLALLLEFLGEGEPVAPPLPGIEISAKPGGRFSPSGWDVGEYYQFRTWCRLVEDARG